jgi:hemerythrin
MPNDFNIGIGEFDEQHRAFFLHMVSLRRALIDGTGGRDKLMNLLRFLDTFVEEHFAAEERYMRRHNYPGILVHRLDHEKFAKNVADFKKKAKDLDSRDEVLSFLAVEIEQRLEKWLDGHIRTMDRKMAGYLRERM